MRSCSAKSSIIGWALCCTLLLSGCSAIRLGYNQAPTLVWWWLDGYLDFSAEQAPVVKDALNAWFGWHRSTQLADYANLLAAAQPQVLQAATPTQVCRWSDELRARFAAAVAHGVPLAATVVPTLGAEQLAYLEKRYRKSNAEFEKEFLQVQPDERIKASVKRTVERAEMLYGKLDERQRQAIAAGLAASPFDPVAWYAERRAVQTEVLQTLGRLVASGPGRSDVEASVAALKVLALRLQRAPEGEYRNYQLRLSEYNCTLVAQLHNSTTLAQRQAARARLKEWEDDLRALAGQRAPAAEPDRSRPLAAAGRAGAMPGAT